jgi:hypothetical protein
MEAVSVRKTRVRRPKEVPEFYETKGSLVVKPPPLIFNNLESIPQFHIEGLETLDICPYTPYIPMLYLNYGTPVGYNYSHFSSVKSANSVLHKKKLEDLEDGLFKSFLSHTPLKHGAFLFSSGFKKTFEAIVRGYLSYDSVVGFERTPSYTNGWMVENVVSAFSNAKFNNFGLRSYKGHVGMLSMFIEHSPYVMAVTLPEYYLQHKYNLLLGRPMDLSKVVVLVDRRLDLSIGNEMPIAFIKLYRDSLEPILKDSGVKIVKCPLEYIKENCFVGTHRLTSRRYMERKAEKQEFIEKFYKSIVERRRPRAATPVIDVTPTFVGLSGAGGSASVWTTVTASTTAASTGSYTF